jgi:hypothetical protein
MSPGRARAWWLVVLAAAAVPASRTGAQPKVPAPEQIAARRAFAWNGGVIVETAAPPPHRYLSLQLASGALTPLSVPELDEILDLATYGGKPVAAGLRGGKLALLVLESGTFRPVTAILPGLGSTQRLRLLGDAKWLVLVERDGTSHWLTGGAWRKRKLAFGPARLALLGGRLFAGRNAGEFGGGLVVLDLTVGTLQTLIPISGCTRPVAGLELGPDGKLWVLESKWHGGPQQGRLRVLEEGGWRTLAANDILWRQGAKAGRRQVEQAAKQGICPGDRNFYFDQVNWSLPYTSFDGLSFDRDRRPVMVTQNVGLVRLAGKQWQRLPRQAGLDGLRGFWEFITIVGDRAVLGTSAHGLVLFGLQGGEVRRVALPKAPERQPAGREDEPADRCAAYAVLAGAQLQALDTALADFAALLKNRPIKGTGQSLKSYRVRLRKTATRIEVDFTSPAAGGATYTLRPPFRAIEKRVIRK